MTYIIEGFTKKKDIEEWIRGRRERGHDVTTIILDRTTGRGILTTFDPMVIAGVQPPESAKRIQLKEVEI